MNRVLATHQTVSVLWFRGLLQAAESLGMSPERLLEHCEVTAQQLEQPYARLTLEQNLKLWRAIERDSQHPNIGLAMGAQVKPSYFQLLALTLMQSPNLAEALNKSMRYTRLLSDGGSYYLETNDQLAAICYEPQAEGFSSHQVDAVLVLLNNFASWLACKPLPLVQVEMAYPKPENISEYQKVFAVPVLFGAVRNALIFEVAVLAEPLSFTDNYLAQLHEQMLENHLAQITEQDTANKVRYCLRAAADLTLTRDDIAKLLNMSGRSLQRKLKECDTNFQALLDEERYSRAREYLKQPQLTLTDISAQLGFAESSVFTRAFKRWSGMAPIEYRHHYIERNNANVSS